MDATDKAEVVCDAGPILHLDELGALGLLAGWTPRVPDAVWSEVLRHRHQALGQRR